MSARGGRTDQDEWEVVCGAEWSIVNELSNKIDLGFKLLKRGTRRDVLMRIAGPTSEATNQVTLMEAREIHRGLKDLLAVVDLGAVPAADLAVYRREDMECGSELGASEFKLA